MKQKLFKLIELVLLVLSLVAFVVYFACNNGTAEDGLLNMYLYWTYALLAIAIVLVVLFSLAKAFKSKKGIIGLVAIIVGVVVVLGAAYLLAPGTPVGTKTYDAGTLKFADTALYVTYLFFAASILALVWGLVRNALKK